VPSVTGVGPAGPLRESSFSVLVRGASRSHTIRPVPRSRQIVTSFSPRAAVTKMRSRVSEVEGNQLSVRLELQADCFAGIFGNYADAQGMIEPGDFDEGLRAASAIGDDRLQRRSGGMVMPDSFTHGTSKQRESWLHRGIQTGSVESCDTFKAADL